MLVRNRLERNIASGREHAVRRPAVGPEKVGGGVENVGRGEAERGREG